MSHKLWLTALCGLVAVALLAVGAVAVAGSRSLADPSRTDSAVALGRAAPHAAAQQTAALADGRVTREEYDNAVGAAVSCMVARGHSASLVPGDGRQPASLTFSVASLDAAGLAESDLAECKQRYTVNLLAVWIEQNRPTPQEAADARRFVASCIAGRGGSTTTADPNDRDISDWMDSSDPVTRIAAGKCIEERNRVYGF